MKARPIAKHPDYILVVGFVFTLGDSGEEEEKYYVAVVGTRGVIGVRFGGELYVDNDERETDDEDFEEMDCLEYVFGQEEMFKWAGVYPGNPLDLSDLPQDLLFLTDGKRKEATS